MSAGTSAALDLRAAEPRGARLDPAHRLRMLRRGCPVSMCAPMRAEDVEERGAPRVEEDVLDVDEGVGHDEAGHDEEGGAGDVARARRGRGDGGAAPPWTETAAPCTSTGTPNAGSRRSVWSRVRAGSTTVVRPFGLQGGEQHRRLHLRAGRRHGPGHALSGAAVDDEGRPPVGRRRASAHHAQRARPPARRAGGAATRPR